MRKNFYLSTLGSVIFLDFVISDIAKLAIIIAFWHKKKRGSACAALPPYA